MAIAVFQVLTLFPMKAISQNLRAISLSGQSSGWQNHGFY